MQKTAKEKILHAATSLFAQKGYSAVGVRDIAKMAEVNISMISYYFDGKAGILKAIIENFSELFEDIFRNIENNISPEQYIRMLIKDIVRVVRENLDLAMVTFNELPLNLQEIAEIKSEWIIKLIKNTNRLIPGFNYDPDDTSLTGMISPALIALIFTHFRMRPVIKQSLNIEFDHAFYERFTENIATLFLRGIAGIAEEKERMYLRNKNENSF